MDDNLLFVGEAQSVFTDERDSEGDTVHGLFTTWPVHELILGLKIIRSRSNTVHCQTGLT